MPIYSMTGYASAQTELTSDTANSPALRLGLEIRSVNSRFLDLTFKMPEELRQHEAALRELVMKHLKRGKVEVRAHIETTADTPFADPTPRLLQRLSALQDTVHAWLPKANPLSVADVLRLEQASGPLLALYFVAGAVSLPLWVRLAATRGRARAWLASMLLAMLAFKVAGRLLVGSS